MRALERRIERLEGGTRVSGDVERAYATVHAFNVVDHHPEEAAEADRDLVAATPRDEWQRALAVVIEAEGGLEAVVRRSMQLVRAMQTLDGEA